MGQSETGCSEVRVAIVGAGPQGMAAALHLLEADPTIHGELVVVDPAGRWMQRWDERLARLEVDHLRSPGVHHPGCDPYQLGVWAHEHELESRLPCGLPATLTFQGYCMHLVADADLAEHVVPTKARRIEPGRHRTVLVLGDGTRLPARHVVLAGDPARRRIPRWAFDALPVPPRRLEHADDIDLRGMDIQGEHIAIVGGGLTAGHLATGAVARGAAVTLLCRRSLRERMFDTDPAWLGPRALDAFHLVTDPARRLELALAARDGGSMPPWMTRRIDDATRAGQLRVIASQRVCALHTTGTARRLRLVLGDEARLDVDRVWLATGTQPDVAGDRLTSTLQHTHPTRLVGGWPLLEHDDLRWPGTNVHVLGRLAMLSLGPAAGNLWGARVGARRVASQVVARPTERLSIDSRLC